MVSPSSKLYQRQRALREIVADEIRRQIFSGALAPGTRLVERDLADAFSVSRAPVREALRALHNEGLTESLSTRGLIVRTFDRKEVQELFDIREALEGLAAGQAAQNASDDDVNQLASLVTASQNATASGDLDAAHDANLRFHDEVVRLSGNGCLQETLAPVAGRLHWLFRQVPDLTEVGLQHHQIVCAIRSGDALAADSVARTHVAYYRQQTEVHLFGTSAPSRSGPVLPIAASDSR